MHLALYLFQGKAELLHRGIVPFTPSPLYADGDRQLLGVAFKSVLHSPSELFRAQFRWCNVLCARAMTGRQCIVVLRKSHDERSISLRAKLMWSIL